MEAEMEAVNWGILGASNFAREQMAPAIHAASGARLSALATSTPEKAAGFRAFCPDVKVCESYAALLDDPAIDAVYIPLPNHLHVDWTLKALEAGKHVLCEKPMAMQGDDFDKLIAKRDETGLLAAEAFMIVFHPQWQWIRDRITEGAIGRLQHVSGIFSFDNRDPENIRNRADTGGGALRDIGVYTIGSTRFATGAEPEDVRAQIRWDGGIDGFASLEMRFAGFTCSTYVSMRMHPFQEMTFHGDAGVIRARTPFNARVFGEASVEWHKPGLTVETIRFPAANQYVLQVEAFNRAVRGSASYPCPLEFSRGTQDALDSAFAGAETLPALPV